MNKRDLNKFIVMCVMEYAEFSNKSCRETYALMNEKGLIEFMVEDYEDLHGFSTMYLNNFFHDYIRVRENNGTHDR